MSDTYSQSGGKSKSNAGNSLGAMGKTAVVALALYGTAALAYQVALLAGWVL